MYLKTGIILASFVALYFMLVFVAATWWQALPLAIMLGLSMAAIGFNIEHDGGHQAYSNHAWINPVMAMTMDLIGASSYVWHWKHVVVHHTYTNLTGHDADIDLGIFGRLTPHQKRFRFHRWQHFYLWPLYGANIIKWHLYDDFRDVILGRIGSQRMPRVCHVNYPAISKLVEQTCREFGVRYREHRSFRAGLASHFRWLRRMGAPAA